MLVFLAWSVFATLALGDPPLALPDTPFEQFTRAPFVQGSEEENDVRSIAVTGQGEVWVATAAGPRQIVDGRFALPPGEELAGPTYGIAVSDANQVWIAAWNGLYRLDNGSLARVEGLNGPVTAVAGRGERVLAATNTGLFERQAQRWVKLNVPCSGDVRQIAISNQLLAVASGAGCHLYDGKKSTRVSLNAKVSSTVLGIDVRADGSSSRAYSLFVGTSAGAEQFHLDLATSTARSRGHWSPQEAFVREGNAHYSPHVRTILPSSRIHRVLGRPGEANKQVYWLATPSGLTRVVMDGDEPASIEHFHSQRWLPSDDVRDIAIAPDGSLWCATARGVGLLRGHPLTLTEKANFFEKMIEDRHVRPPGLVERCGLRRVGDLSSWYPVDTDNDGEYTGTYLAAEAYRFAVTKDPEAKRKAEEAFSALEFLQTATGTPGFIARTVIPSDWTSMADPNLSVTPRQRAEQMAEDPRDKIVERRWRLSDDLKWLWKGDTSSDEITGHFYAFGIYYDLVADEAGKSRARELARRVMDGIIEAEYTLRDIDGTHTRWGVWSPEKLNGDPNWANERGVNSVEILSYLTTTHHMTGDAKYDKEIDRLLREHHYDENILSPRRTDIGSFTYIDDELLAMAYRGLVKHETKPERLSLYRKSLQAWIDTIKHDASPCYNFIFAELAENPSVQDVNPEGCIRLLRDVPLDMIHWSIDNTRREDVRLVRRPQAEALQTNVLLPPSETPVLRWDNNPYRAQGGEGGHAEMCPAFWLWGYWVGRYTGYIAE